MMREMFSREMGLKSSRVRGQRFHNSVFRVQQYLACRHTYVHVIWAGNICSRLIHTPTAIQRV